MKQVIQKKVLVVVSLLLLPLTAIAESSGFTSVINMSKGVSELSRTIYDIHMLVFWICVVICVLVFGFMFYVMWAHRKSKGSVPAQFHDHHTTEVIWTVIPALICFALIFPAGSAIIDAYDTDDAELTVKVTGLQWKWQYEYLGKDVKLLSELTTPMDEIQNASAKGENYLQEVTEPLVIPVDTKVVFKITGADVIHSWWVPDFAVKRDAIPGFINDAWVKVEETGVYYGACTELCGKNHAFMPVVVKVVEKEEFTVYIAKKQREAAEFAKIVQLSKPLEEMMELGEAAYNRSCASCHGADGKGITGVFPSLVGTPYITGSLANHIDIVVNGKSGTAMQAFGSQLNELDIAAIITYERNAWGNKVDDNLVQPKDILNFKSQ